MARSRFRRPDDALPPLRWTPRDDAILADVARLGHCLIEHLQALHFPSYKTAAERAMKLFHHGYLARAPLPAERGQPTMVHTLAPGGVAHLANAGVPSTVPAPLSVEALRHALDVTAAVVAFLAASPPSGTVVRFIDRTLAPLRDGGAIRPDAAVLIETPTRRMRRLVLLDIDRPDAPEALAQRVQAWLAWTRQPPPALEAWIGALLTAHAVPADSVRAQLSLAWLGGGSDRLAQIATTLRQAGAARLIYLADLEALVAQGGFAPLWQRADALGTGRPLVSVLGDAGRR
ncbi:MAG: hypothetical protein KC620_06685 [Myxococcales bacterium]|nr:hypothetical protein [Myxococcales bacterium]